MKQRVKRGKSQTESGKELEIRSRVAEIFLTATDERMFDEVLALVLEVMESEFGVFGYIDDKGALVVPTMTRHIWEQCRVADKAIVFPRAAWGESTWPQSIREKRTICLNETSTKTPVGHIPVTRHISMPVIQRGEVVGLLLVGNKETDYTKRDIELLEIFGKVIAPILHARLQRDKEEKERRSAVEAQRESESLNRCIVDNIPYKVFLKDRKSVYLSANPSYAKSVGKKPSDFLGKDDFAFYPVDLANKYRADDKLVMESGEIKDLEEKFLAEGKERTLHTIKVPVRNDAGEVIALLGIFEDITEHKLAENELKKYREHLEELVKERTADLNLANEQLSNEVTESRRLETSLREKTEQLVKEDWIRDGVMRLLETVSGYLDIKTLCTRAITEMARYIDAQVGAIYVPRSPTDTALSLMGSYAWTRRDGVSTTFEPGEGVIGQVALDKKQILIKNVPRDYLKVASGLGDLTPRQIFVIPFLLEGQVKGVVELGTIGEMTDQHTAYLSQALVALAIAVEGAHARETQARSLERAQCLAEELQVQQEELRAANEELEGQTQRLQASEQKLKVQQEELQAANEELEENNDLLERQKKEAELARLEIVEKARQLALASKYKSEFLANMSHELRSPLNSLLLLAQGLSQNKPGNLTGEQVESARIIHQSGSDLLNLINEILDLSKIEAGRMDFRTDKMRTIDLAENARASFGHLAEEKGVVLNILVSEEAPREITTDPKRVDQIIRNLMSNALKFTESGSVTLTFDRATSGVNLSQSGLEPEKCFAVSVQDTGIGISPEEQKSVFEAFYQVDGGTARKYSGTGLGLAISRKLAVFLGGEIQLQSELGKGSVFTLFLPIESAGEQRKPSGPPERVAKVNNPPVVQKWTPPVSIEDDRNKLEKEDRVILIIEDDTEFARTLVQKCHEKGFKCLATPTGEEGIELAGKFLPSAVILDIRLPGIDGWTVLNALKEDTRTRHIPVHTVSAIEDPAESRRKGALAHFTKPISLEAIDGIFQKLVEASSRKPWRLLVVEDNPEIRRSTIELIGNGDVVSDEAANGAKALEALRATRYDCMVLDLGLPDMSGSELLARAEREGLELPPVVIHTARDLTSEEEMELRQHAESIIIKDVRSQERLLDEVSLFLHRVVSQMPERKRKIIRDLHDTDAFLSGKKILIVDDDMRTTFALSGRLSERGVKTLKADNGERALRLLIQEPNVDLVLMDIMMPVMDGYEAIRRIRAQERFRKLPILALTAKAMPEDREKCLEAGASDYLPKPVDEARLISMMRVWLYR
ncbi:MAG: response regulator [Candidatus Ozemobacteraceae bacterium]